ncbi:uncharacterized protein METZ01_LOCUS322424 [marine metagenome]|uniref:Uncharacterized protein n=1 Tax=marine metagenome TaxID=408172 RepID=A0A382P9R3_9ZZZZ
MSLDDSLFLGVIQLNLNELSLVVKCCLLCDNRHICRGSTLHRTTDDSVVGIGCSGKRFPDASGEGMVALTALPDACCLAPNLLILAYWAGVVPGLLLEC